MNIRYWLNKLFQRLVSWLAEWFRKKEQPQIVHVIVCQDSMLLARECCKNTIPALYEKGNEPKKLCNLHKKKSVRICTISHKKANKWCPKWVVKKFCPDKIPKLCKIHRKPKPLPPPPPIKSSRLTIHDGVICYKNGGTVPIILIGDSRWEALAREKGIAKGDWGDKSLAWYEEQLINSGINYVRHGIVPDMEFVREHCERMAKAGIIVELTIHNSQVKYDMGDPFKAVNMTIDLPNVFYDVHNEFCDNRIDVQKARELIAHIRDRGGICSAGAWGHCTHGFELSKEFDPVLSKNQIISVHREWDKASIKKYTGYNKPVIRNEFFARYNPPLSLDDVKQIFRKTIEVGGQGCMYYGIDCVPDLKAHDPFGWKELLYWAGSYCQKINQ